MQGVSHPESRLLDTATILAFVDGLWKAKAPRPLGIEPEQRRVETEP